MTASQATRQTAPETEPEGRDDRHTPRPPGSPPEQPAERLVVAGLVALALLPPLYLFTMVQYSGLTYPFWDENDLLRWISDLYTGHLDVSSLWAPHNHSRPL